MTLLECAVEDCARPVKTKGLCNPHYLQQHRGKPFTTPRRRSLKNESTTCSADGCAEQAVARTYCNTHYAQWTRLGRVFPINSTHRPKGSNAERDDQGRKFCRACETWKPVGEFYGDSRAIDKLKHSCKKCHLASTNKAAARQRYIQVSFNLTIEEYEGLLEGQGHRCAICRTDNPGKRDWAIDHDHECCPESGRSCGKCVRGLLCARCNLTLGMVRDDPALLAQMIQYLTS